MTDLNTDHLSQRERYLMSMVYSAFLGYTKDQDHSARQVNHIVKSADELEPATTPQPSADAVREIYDAAAKGFHTSETNGAERKYLHVIRFQSIEDLHGYEDAWTAAMVKARDAK